MCVFVRDGEDLDSQGEGSSQPDTISLASRTSQNTLDSDKVRMMIRNDVLTAHCLHSLILQADHVSYLEVVCINIHCTECHVESRS